MDIKRIAEQDIQEFIFEHENDDEYALVLKYKDIHGVPSAWIASQIKSRRKATEKIPVYYGTPGVVYPPSLNLEQSSSEATARFKSYITWPWLQSKGKVCDLTGGFGVDAFFVSFNCPHYDYVEPNQELFEIAKHNHRLLNAMSIHHHNKEARDFLSYSHINYDLIYIDPSRRSSSQKKGL